MDDYKVDWKSKLTSRKFWVAVTNFVTMLVLAFGVAKETATQIAAIIMAGAAVIAYIIGEGLIDAAGAGNESPLILGPDSWSIESVPKEDHKESNSDAVG